MRKKFGRDCSEFSVAQLDPAGFFVTLSLSGGESPCLLLPADPCFS